MSSQSMTGFGRGEASNDNYSLVVEIKSVNHRFKDVRFKMSSLFNAKEIELRQKIDKNFHRGSFDIYASYKKNQENHKKIEIDFVKVNSFIEQLHENIDDGDVNIQINPTEFLRNEFTLEDETKEGQLQELLVTAFNQAITDLKQSRLDEGDKLLNVLKEHKEKYYSFFEQIPPLKEKYQPQVKEKFLKRFKEQAPDLNIEEGRFMQEVIYYLEKLDIDEEINRVTIHLNKLDELMSQGKSELGRQIDFLIQELNRETNTIGSKSGSNDISELVVQMKVQIEKIREQALNLQ